MRIAYILHSTLKHAGASKSFLTMLKGAMNNGVTPFVVVPDTNGLYHDLYSMGIEVCVFNYRPAVYPWQRNLSDYLLFLPRLLGRIYLNSRATHQLIVYLKGKSIDIIHSNSSVIDIGFRAARKLSIPHIYHIREYADKDFDMHYYPSKGYFHQQLNSTNNYTVCITKDIQRHHQQDTSPRSCVIYNGIAHSKQQKPQHTRGDYFLFAGRVEKAKGLDFLIESYIKYVEQTAGDPLPLYIAGEIFNHDLKAHLDQEIREHGIQDKVKFLGLQSDMESLMAHARAVIIPSPHEAFGRCMPEAMLCGCLTIARNTGGTLEQLENGMATTGEDIALRFSTTDQLAANLQLATNLTRENYNHITTKAWRTVTSLYSIESYVEAVLSLYQRITNEHTN